MKNNVLAISVALLAASAIVVWPTDVHAVNRNAVWDMDGFWWLDDDASGLNNEDNTGFGAGDTVQETHITGVAKNSIVRLRIDISETNNQNQNDTIQPRIEFQSGDVTCTDTGTWTTISTDTANAWALSDSTTITDGDAVDSDRVSGNVKAFSNSDKGELLDQSNPSTGADPLSNKSQEHEFAIIATDNASDSQIYTFRITNNGTVLNNYNLPTVDDCPEATTASAAVPTYTLNDYRWYVDSDSEDVTDPWGNPDLAENTAITTVPVSNDPPDTSQELRLRTNFTVNTTDVSASSQQFKLQFKAGTDSDCTTGTWTDVGAGNAWEFASSSVTDGTTLSALKLAASDVLEVYAKSNPTATNPNGATQGQDIEYDFHIVGTNSASATQYSFRAVESDDTVFDGYTTCPTLTTEPATSDLMRHGNFFADEVEKGFFWAD